MTTRQHLALYYPGHMWRSGDSIKNLLLFFDGLALLVPQHLRGEIESSDSPTLRGLWADERLILLDPADLITEEVASELVAVMEAVVDTRREAFGNLLMAGFATYAVPNPRLTWLMEWDEGSSLREQLIGRKQIWLGEDEVRLTNPLSDLLMALLAQAFASRLSTPELALSPATDLPEVEALARGLIFRSTGALEASVVSLDLDAVGVDLTNASLDDIAHFRAEFGDEFRKYVWDVRKATQDVIRASPEVRGELLSRRKEELKEASRLLRQRTNKAWGKGASVALGTLAGVWAATQGDPVAGFLAIAGLLFGAVSSSEPSPEAFSYVLRAARL